MTTSNLADVKEILYPTYHHSNGAFHSVGNLLQQELTHFTSPCALFALFLIFGSLPHRKMIP